MNFNPTIVDVTSDNIDKHPQAICFINPKQETYHKKVEWLENQFTNGLKIRLLYIENEKRPVGFIEYVPGEYCWRAVNAKGYMFIHCLWINGKKYQHQGLGSLLIKEAEYDAKNMLGVAVLTSDNAFMAGKSIFQKNSYNMISESGKEQLMIKQFKEGLLPSFNNWQKELATYKNLTIVYSKQCPWVPRFIEEVKPILEKEKLEPDIVEIENAEQAQKAPSLYGVFNLIYNGKLLSDRYISTTRFSNIIKKNVIR